MSAASPSSYKHYEADMRLSTRIRYGLARLLAKSATFSIVPPWVTQSILNPSFRSLTRDGYQKSSAFFACVSALAFSFPEPPLAVYDGDTDEAQQLSQHGLRKLLRRPMPIMGEAELMATTMAYLAIGGNAYWHKIRNKAGQVIQLRPYHAGYIVPVPGGLNWIERYDYDELGLGGSSGTQATSGAGLKPIDVKDIVHFKWPAPDPAQPWMSQPPILAAASEVDSDVEAIRMIFALLANDAVPRTVVTVPADRPMDDAEYERLKEQWREKYGGTNRGDVAVLEAGATVSRLGLNLQELAFDALAKIPESRIAAAMRTPPIIAGLNVGLDRSTYANYGEARKAFTQDTLVPFWRIVASEVEADLLPEFQGTGDRRGVAVRFDTSRVAALQEDHTAKWKRVTDAYKAGLLKRNEGRRALGYSDDAGGDTYYSVPAKPQALPDNSAPKTVVINPDGSVVELPSGAARVLIRHNVVSEPPKGFADLLAERQRDAPPSILASPVSTPDVEQKDSTSDYETKIEKAVTRYLRAQYRKAAEGIRSLGKAASDALDPAIVDQLELDLGPEAQRMMRKYYAPIMQLAWTDAEQVLDVGLSWDVQNEKVQDVLDELAKLVTRITDTTRDDIRALIGKQAAEGWSVDQLAKEIVQAGVTTSRTRAKLIAVTETASAYSKGSILAYKESGVVDEIEWIATIDEHTCEQCKALNGESTKLGKAFSDGSSHPPRHPRCRCAIAPVVKA